MPLLMAEFYIRQTETDAVRGPFEEDQITLLADAGQITLENLVADETQSGWLKVGDSEETGRAVPGKEKIGLKKGKEKDKAPAFEQPGGRGQRGGYRRTNAGGRRGPHRRHQAPERPRQEHWQGGRLVHAGPHRHEVLSGLSNALPRYPVIINLFFRQI